MRQTSFIITMAAITLASGFALAQTASAPGAKEYFINLKDGQHVRSPVLVQFGLSGMGVAPAGSSAAGTGHHHLIVDGELPPTGQPIPMDMAHMHFGRGQTEQMVTLPPGTHVLQLALGDGAHVLHNPPVISDKITITVDP
jgi:uncharacterized protein DUF4399